MLAGSHSLPDERVEDLAESERRYDEDVDDHIGERGSGKVLLGGVRSVKERARGAIRQMTDERGVG